MCPVCRRHDRGQPGEVGNAATRGTGTVGPNEAGGDVAGCAPRLYTEDASRPEQTAGGEELAAPEHHGRRA